MMYEVVEAIKGAHPRHVDYPLLPGDVLYKNEDGTWTKEAPGLTILGFILTEEQEQQLQQVEVERNGLVYRKVKN